MSEDQMRDRVRTRERILAAAEDLLSARSARELKVREVAAHAGVSASLVVQYFLSKDALVLDVGLRRMAEFSPPPPPSDPKAVVAAMLEADAANASLVREVLRQSWWWPKEAETAFQAALEPRRKALRAACPAAPSGQVEAALSAYFEGLRKCLIETKSIHDCLASMTTGVIAVLEPKTAAPEF
ncbi:MAG: TetR/AcrR family transcriptional regulator [Alphaproteobacteria bacterium]|nr:TetR/AcrR family transcriptional regulator [Alphaproteobacteria bacterium]